MKPLMVIGIGNYLLRDEGIGVHVVHQLLEQGVPAGVELVDGGTHSYDLLEFFCQAEKIIVVDAMKAGGEPGAIYRAPVDELGLKPEKNMISLHELHFIEAVEMLRKLGYDPEIIVYGVEPAIIDWGTDLSPQLEAKLPKLLELVDQEITALLLESEK